MTFPWDRLLQVGFGILHLGPEAFWSMTLRELSTAVGRQAPDVKVLRTLMRKFETHA